MVSELTLSGPVPLEGATIYAFACDVAAPHCSVYWNQITTTDRDGAYRLTGVWAGQETTLNVYKDGYTVDGGRPEVYCDGCDRLITASVDTQLDLQVVRN